MEGADGRAVELEQRLGGPIPALGIVAGRRGRSLRNAAGRVSKLGGGFLGEGDRGDLFEGDGIVEHERLHPIDERAVLPEPAPASTNWLVSRTPTMRSRWD